MIVNGFQGDTPAIRRLATARQRLGEAKSLRSYQSALKEHQEADRAALREGMSARSAEPLQHGPELDSWIATGQPVFVAVPWAPAPLPGWTVVGATAEPPAGSRERGRRGVHIVPTGWTEEAPLDTGEGYRWGGRVGRFSAEYAPDQRVFDALTDAGVTWPARAEAAEARRAAGLTPNADDLLAEREALAVEASNTPQGGVLRAVRDEAIALRQAWAAARERRVVFAAARMG